MSPSSVSHFPARAKFRASPSFTLVELLVVILIIAILTAIAVPLIPSLLKANVVDEDVATLSGILEQARETAISRTTYVWVAFTDPPASTPGDGIWVATIQSVDGTEAPINTTVAPSWATSVTIPSAASVNLQMVSKLQNLPGIAITNWLYLPAAVTNLATAAPYNITNPAPLFETNTVSNSKTQWTVSSVQFSEGNSATTYFTHVIEFTPNGEAHVMTWNSNIEFGMIPSTGTSTNNDVLLNLSRFTGKLTVLRP